MVGRVDERSVDLLVPTVLHTLDKDNLPRSLRPQAAPSAALFFVFCIEFRQLSPLSFPL